MVSAAACSLIVRNNSIDAVKVLRPHRLTCTVIAIIRAGQLGALGKAVELLEQIKAIV